MGYCIIIGKYHILCCVFLKCKLRSGSSNTLCMQAGWCYRLADLQINMTLLTMFVILFLFLKDMIRKTGNLESINRLLWCRFEHCYSKIGKLSLFPCSFLCLNLNSVNKINQFQVINKVTLIVCGCASTSICENSLVRKTLHPACCFHEHERLIVGQRIDKVWALVIKAFAAFIWGW